MKKLLRTRNRMKESVEAREEITIPTYTLGKKRLGRNFRRNLIIVSAIVFLFTAIYLPPALIDEPDTDNYASVDLTSSANRASMETAQLYLRNNPEADFDGDGLVNEEELDAGSGVYIADNDNDGVTDYAELYLTETNPTISDDAIQTFVINSDTKNGNSVNTPFKVNDVVLWADDYASKARGSVLPLEDGSYVFYGFKGWVQFPSGNYAYKVQNGLQTALKKNTNGYFYIDTSNRIIVRVYDEQPETCHVISVLGTKYKLADNWIGRTLSFILPSNGFGLITCRPALVNDFDDTWSETAKANEIVRYNVKEFSETRFGVDQRSLTDLSTIFSYINNGNNVIISLMSHNVGESFVEVYGYTNRNNLLICDPSTGADLGVLHILPYSTRMLDESGSIQEYELFSWDGCGYSSSSRHRIMIVDAISQDGKSISSSSKTDKNDTQNVVQSTQDTAASSNSSTDNINENAQTTGVDTNTPAAATGDNTTDITSETTTN